MNYFCYQLYVIALKQHNFEINFFFFFFSGHSTSSIVTLLSLVSWLWQSDYGIFLSFVTLIGCASVPIVPCNNLIAISRHLSRKLHRNNRMICIVYVGLLAFISKPDTRNLHLGLRVFRHKCLSAPPSCIRGTSTGQVWSGGSLKHFC